MTRAKGMEEEAARVMRHVIAAIDAARESAEPFHHLQLAGIFPDDTYAAMMDAMPSEGEYRRMSGRARSSGSTRVKLDLLPEFVRHLPEPGRAVWDVVGRALCSAEVRERLRERLAPGLERRFGQRHRSVGMYPIPVLTRDTPGYRIGIHPDTRHKAITAQIYLPRDRSIEHIGTVFHRKSGDGAFERASQMSFAPNSGYAFAVGSDTYHSVDTVGPEVQTRDSILLTYFADHTLLQLVQNRGKRVGNLVRNELRRLVHRPG